MAAAVTWFERVTPARVVAIAVPFAGLCVGAVVMRTDHEVNWLGPYVVALSTIGIAANLALQYLLLRVLQSVFSRRGITLLDGVSRKTILALLALGTAAGAAVVLAVVRIEPAWAGAATAVFPGLTLVGAMAGAAGLASGLRLAARRALVLVFASQFLLTFALRLL